MNTSSEIQIGSPAIDFSLPDSTGTMHSLALSRGSWVILYVYPKDNTPACTTEALAFSAVYEELSGIGVPVIGISPDSPESHQKFINKHDLKLILLSDNDHTVIEAYGAWKLKKMYGKEYMGVERSTFLIDPTGIIQEIWRQVTVKGHVDAVTHRLYDMKKKFSL